MVVVDCHLGAKLDLSDRRVGHIARQRKLRHEGGWRVDLLDNHTKVATSIVIDILIIITFLEPPRTESTISHT